MRKNYRHSFITIFVTSFLLNNNVLADKGIGKNSISIGENALALAENSIAIGDDSSVIAIGGSAIGKNAISAGKGMAKEEYNSLIGELKEIAIKNKNKINELNDNINQRNKIEEELNNILNKEKELGG